MVLLSPKIHIEIEPWSIERCGLGAVSQDGP